MSAELGLLIVLALVILIGKALRARRDRGPSSWDDHYGE